MQEFLSKSADETKNIAKKFMADLLEGNEATVVELVGDLGAGKTTFMQGIGEFLGVKEDIVSPTFTIQRDYEIPITGKWKKLVHLDAYRIEKKEELGALRFEEYKSDKNNLIFIEWPANLLIDIPEARRIEFFHKSPNERIIKI